MEVITIDIDGQQFEKQESDPDGNCLLYTLLNYLNAKGIDPFLDRGVNGRDVRAYRQFLFETIFEDSILRALQQEAVSKQKDDYLDDCAWLTTDILPLVLGLYPQIERIYVFDRRFMAWNSFTRDGDRVKQEPVTTSFNFTDRMMMMQYTGSHFDLLKPENERVVVKRKRPREEEAFDDASNAARILDDLKNEILLLNQLANDTLLSEKDRSNYRKQLAEKQKDLPILARNAANKRAKYNEISKEIIEKQEEKEKLSRRLHDIENELANLTYVEKTTSKDNILKQVRQEKKILYREMNNIQEALQKMRDGSSSDDAIPIDDKEEEGSSSDDAIPIDDKEEEGSSQTNSQTTESDGTSSDNAITIKDDSSDDERKEDLIQNRSVMSLSRMRL